jgi:allantoinase
LVIDGQRIAEVIDETAELGSLPLEDVGDWVVSPGLVDAHVHINEPGRSQWEGFETATKAAAAGGVTTIIDMPLNSSPVTTTAAALAEKKRAAENQCCVEVQFYGGLVPGNVEQLHGLFQAGVKGIKAFLCDSGLDEFPAASEADLRAAMPLLRDWNLPLLVHAELVDHDVPEIRDVRCYQQYLASRPDRFEQAAIALLIDLCREYRCRVHIVHLATAVALPMLEAARSEGLPITVETCPHYLYFASERIRDGQTQFKCAPPIRSEQNRRDLCDALTAGQIDTIGSDHSPCPPELKHLDVGDFSRAWGGIASLQLTLPIIWTLAQQSGWSIDQLAKWLSMAPAKNFGLQHKGQISVGYDADFCVWDPESEWTVVGQQLHHRHSVTPYDGEQLRGLVKQTYVRGKLVYGTRR